MRPPVGCPAISPHERSPLLMVFQALKGRQCQETQDLTAVKLAVLMRIRKISGVVEDGLVFRHRYHYTRQLERRHFDPLAIAPGFQATFGQLD
ncbi:MAG TPA: hypothetical protein VHP11_04715, partial [Tepidisphaeraceae bacterium]|nr:hypothetical protein [Tepidisphaeraceae bacterium]